MTVKAKDNTIFIGKKPTMSYVLAAITQLGDNNEVFVRARGKSISTAVDVVEVVKNKYIKGLNQTIVTGTEQLTDKDNKTFNVSTIMITLKK